MQRVVIVGTSGAGKTTLGKRLAKKLGATFIELDALHWLENWTPNPDFAEKVAQALETECWVVDGNYSSKLQRFTLDRADTLIWLDYSIGTKLWRLIQRTGRRVMTREVLWNGNTETVKNMLFSRDSLFIWFFKSHWAQRRRYGVLFAEAQQELELYRFTQPEDVERLLEATR